MFFKCVCVCVCVCVWTGLVLSTPKDDKAALVVQWFCRFELHRDSVLEFEWEVVKVLYHPIKCQHKIV
jgi:hypothetical protein